MALQSMTGFARAQGEYKTVSWTWEMRSVNSKGLDIRLRVPQGFEALEIKARSLLSKAFSRGNIQVGLQVTQHAMQAVPSLNSDIVEALMSAAKELQAKVGGELPSASDLMAMRGVVEFSEPDLDEEERAARDASVLESLGEAILSLKTMRVSEGEAVAAVLKKQVEKISDYRQKIDINEARSPEAIRSQLSLQVEKLMETGQPLDPQRLHQEAVVMAAKADLQEELDRLSVHVEAAQELLNSKGPVGRKLDFLAQEFNRECNTICSKSNSAEVTSLGLDMKLVIDQFREQLQNME